MNSFAARDQRVNQGGLMRCCLDSLADYVNGLDKEANVLAEGTVHQCKYTDDPLHRMVLSSTGVWAWDHKSLDT